MSPDDLRDWLRLLSCVSRGAARRLLARHSIEIPVFNWQDHSIVRLSVQGYNSKPQMDLLLDALTEMLDLNAEPTPARQHG